MKKIKCRLLYLITFSFLLILPLLSFGQESIKTFLQSSNLKEITLKPEQEKRFENLKNNRLHKTVQFVKIGNLSKISKANRGALPIKIPGINNTFVARPTKVEFISETNYVWKGTFLRTEGSVTIICQNGVIIVHIAIKDKLFEIHTFDEGKNILIEFNKEELSESVCGNINTEDLLETTKQEDPSAQMKAAPIPTTAVVRVLFLYT